MTLGDRVAVMDAGRIRQVAPPLEVYREPADAFVASFIGSPEMNLRPGRVAGDVVDADGLAFPLPVRASAADGDEVRVGVRPGDLRLVPAGDGVGDARVDVIEPLGKELLVHLLVGASGGPELRALAPPDADLAEDRTVGVAVAPEAIHLFDADRGARLSPRSP